MAAGCGGQQEGTDTFTVPGHCGCVAGLGPVQPTGAYISLQTPTKGSVRGGGKCLIC